MMHWHCPINNTINKDIQICEECFNHRQDRQTSRRRRRRFWLSTNSCHSPQQYVQQRPACTRRHTTRQSVHRSHPWLTHRALPNPFFFGRSETWSVEQTTAIARRRTFLLAAGNISVFTPERRAEQTENVTDGNQNDRIVIRTGNCLFFNATNCQNFTSQRHFP